MMIKQKRKLNQHIIQSLTSDFKVPHFKIWFIIEKGTLSHLLGKKEFILYGKTTPKTWYCLSVRLSGGRIMF